MVELTTFGFYPTHSFLNNTTIHGLKYLARQSYLSRFMFFLICGSVVSFCVWQVTRTVDAYLEFPTTLKKISEVNEKLKFPAITICSDNSYNRFKVGQRPELYQSAYMATFPVDKRSSVADMLCYEKRAQHLTATSGSTLYPAEYPNFLTFIKDVFIHSLNSVVSCEVKRNPVNCSDWFFNKFTDNGFCFTLNQAEEVINDYPYKNSVNATYFGNTIPDGITIKTGGANEGIAIILKDNQTEHCIPAGKEVAGFLAFVHDREVEPLLNMKHLVDLPLGFNTDIGIGLKRVVRNTKTWPTQTCVDEYPLEFYPTAKYYAADNWKKDCMARKTWDKCRCITAYVPPKAGIILNISDTLGEVLCGINMSVQICSWRLELQAVQKKHCSNRQNLPVPCLETKYTMSISSSKYPSVKNFEKLKRDLKVNSKMSYKEFRETFLRVNFYIASKTTDMVQIDPGVSWVGLMNQMGGAVGMSLGISILSFWEIFSWLILQIAALFQQMWTLKKPTTFTRMNYN